MSFLQRFPYLHNRSLWQRCSRFFSSKSTLSVLVVGIGNPTPTYNGTRHSVGHYILDKMIEEYWTNFGSFKPMALNSLFVYSKSQTAELSNVLLAKTVSSYMNLSGTPVSKLWQKYHQQNLNSRPAMVVLHDELQVPLGKIQIRRRNTSARGHNGLRSIDQAIGSNYIKLAIGIGKPPQKTLVLDFVLAKFSPVELETLAEKTMPKVAKAMAEFAKGQHIYETYDHSKK